MDKPSNEQPEKSYVFFKVISADNKSYLCDFYKLEYKNGDTAAHVILQASGHSIWVDMKLSETRNWKIINQSEDISSHLLLELSIEIMRSGKF